jgi:hypothetical protein
MCSERGPLKRWLHYYEAVRVVPNPVWLVTRRNLSAESGTRNVHTEERLCEDRAWRQPSAKKRETLPADTLTLDSQPAELCETVLPWSVVLCYGNQRRLILHLSPVMLSWVPCVLKEVHILFSLQIVFFSCFVALTSTRKVKSRRGGKCALITRYKSMLVGCYVN